ncbi:somatostatin-2-like [Vanacampus margaritifer]
MRGCERSLLVVCLLLCGSAVSSQPDPDRDQDRDWDLDLDLDKRQHQMLQQAAHGTGDLSQGWSERALEQLLARMAPASERLSARMTAERSAERSVEPPNNLPPRERKAGCKNFYWKGFTSC